MGSKFTRALGVTAALLVPTSGFMALSTGLAAASATSPSLTASFKPTATITESIKCVTTGGSETYTSCTTTAATGTLRVIIGITSSNKTVALSIKTTTGLNKCTVVVTVKTAIPVGFTGTAIVAKKPITQVPATCSGVTKTSKIKVHRRA